MKKILAVIMSALLILTAFAACSRSGEGNNTAQGMTESAANAKYKVYLITIDKMDQHWVSVDKGASDMAKQLGITYKWDAPDVKDNAKQIEAVNNAIADGASLIMLAANDPSAISQTVKNAKDKGVKIIYVDSPANEPAVTTLSTDNYNAGMIAGETMLEELKNAGITSGKIGIIGVNTATNSSMNREKGFREAITKDGKFTLLTTEYKDGNFASSQEAATGFITGNSDLVGLYGTNEGSTVGVGNAIKDSGKKIIGIGFDTSNTIESLINDGSLKAVMVRGVQGSVRFYSCCLPCTRCRCAASPGGSQYRHDPRKESRRAHGRREHRKIYIRKPGGVLRSYQRRLERRKDRFNVAQCRLRQFI